MTSAIEFIKRRVVEAQAQVEKAEKAMRLAERYTDLKVSIDRWERERYVSASVNSLCDDMEIRHNGGCCEDSPVEIWPFLASSDGSVYAAGGPFRVGEKAGGYEVPWEGWETTLRLAQIPNVLIERVAKWFDARQAPRDDSCDWNDLEEALTLGLNAPDDEGGGEEDE